MKSKTNDNPQDLYIAQKLRERRLEMRFSQKDLAKDLKISLQQIHKYEKNIDRISAVRLYELAKLLSVPLNYFFDDRKEGPQEKQLAARCINQRGRKISIDSLQLKATLTDRKTQEAYELDIS